MHIKSYALLFCLFSLAACWESTLSVEIKGKSQKKTVVHGKKRNKISIIQKKDTIHKVIPPEKIKPISFPIGDPIPEPFPDYQDPPVQSPILDPILATKDTIYEFASVMPEFPGGKQAFLNYIHAELIYPEIAKELGLEGKVILSFVVFEDGSLHEAKILRGVQGGAPLEKEALRLISQSPNWIPGKKEGGEPIKVRVTIPVIFKLL